MDKKDQFGKRMDGEAESERTCQILFFILAVVNTSHLTPVIAGTSTRTSSPASTTLLLLLARFFFLLALLFVLVRIIFKFPCAFCGDLQW